MDAMFVQLKKLYDNELYVNVLPIACIMRSAYNTDRSLLTPEQYFLTLVYHANSLFQQHQYRKADLTFREALLARKQLAKSKSSTVVTNNYENLINQFPDYEIRYKSAMCLEKEKKNTEAITMLQSIPTKQRTLKINMLLGKLCERVGRVANAVSALKMVLKECPLNLEAIKLLLSLSVTELEIDIIIADSNLPPQCSEWLSACIDAYTSMYRCRFTDAITKLQTLETKSIFGRNEVFTVLIGQCYHYNGDFDNALEYLSRAYANNPHMVDGITTLASLYALKDKPNELEKLTCPVGSPAEHTSEYWFIWGQFLASQGKYEKATYFAHKACYLNPRNIEAALLKAKVFLELKKYKEAILQFKTLLQYAAHRFEVYEGLVVSYVATFRLREAQLIATDAVRVLGKNPRTYVLVARPLLSDVVMKAKAKTFLEKAIELNRNYMPAILLMLELYQEENDLNSAVRLLKRITAVQPTSQLFTLLGEIYSEKEPMQALEFYTKAINMDPANRKAKSGLLDLEQNMNPKEDTSAAYAPTSPNETPPDNFEMMEAQQMTPPNDVLPDIEEESEALWSDVEIDVTNNA